MDNLLHKFTIRFFGTAALIFILNGLLAQNSRDTALHFYYKTNEVNSELNFLRMDSLIQKLNAKTIQMRIYGFADFMFNEAYNLQLSQNRANAMRKFILDHFTNVNITVCRAYGEKFSADNGSANGDALQRRVDVVIERVIPLKEVDTQPVKVEPLPENQTAGKPSATVKQISDLNKLQKGNTITLEGLSFEAGRHYMLKGSAAILQRLLETLKENPKLKIEIHGHVCCTFGDLDGLDYDTNERTLSLNRAKAIYEFLVKNGIAENRLSYKGLGHSQPKINPEVTPEDEQTNRRVEILVVENE